MLFVGSKKNLLIIGKDYKDIWISFVREFNRFRRKNKLPVLGFKNKVLSIQNKVEILTNLAIKKEKSYGKDNKYFEAKHNLVSLITSLNHLKKSISELLDNLPSFGDVYRKEINFSLATIMVEIKEVKALNDLVAQSILRLGRRGFIKRAGKITAGTAITLLTTGGSVGLINSTLTYLAKDLPLKRRNGLAILISYNTPKWWDAPLKPAAKLLIPTYVARIELAFGQKANVVKKGATKQDLEKVLKDGKIQNVVIYGHGSWYGWLATDGMVLGDDLIGWYWQNDKKNKNGFFVRHTCGISKIKDVNEFKFKVEEWVEEMQRLNQIVGENNKKLKYYFRAVKKSSGGKREGLYILNEKDSYVPKWRTAKQFSIFLIEMAFTGAGWKIEFGVTPTTRDYWLDSNKVHQKGNFSKEIGKYRERLYGKDPESGKIFDELIKEIDRFVSSLKVEKKEYKMYLFGRPFYKKSQIKGWDRVSYPPEFLINVFGQNDQKEDKLYKVANAEKIKNGK